MSKKIISFGLTSKKLTIPFLFTLTQIINDIFDKYYPQYDKNCTKDCEKIENNILNSFALAIGGMLVIIIPHIKIFSDKNEQFERKIIRTKLKIFFHYFILNAIYGSMMGTIFIIEKIKNEDTIAPPHLYGLCIKEAFEIVFLSVACYILLKYKLFIHNIIGLIFFCITCVSIDLILKMLQYELKNVLKFVLENIIYILLESAYFTYQKYMMEKLYYSPFKITFVIQIFLFIVICFSLMNILKLGREGIKNAEERFNNFYEYFDKVKTIIIIIKFIMTIILNFFIYLFECLTIYHFTPNYILISYGVSKMVKFLLNNTDNTKYICIILFILQFIFLLIFLEIIELNFCGLSDNIKKNISIRSEKDMSLVELESDSDRDSLVEIAPGYIVNKNQIDLDEDILNKYNSKSNVYSNDKSINDVKLLKN